MIAVRRTALVLGTAAVLSVPALAQTTGGALRVFVGGGTQSLAFRPGLGLRSATEIAVPIGAIWTLSPRLSLDVGASYARVTRASDDTAARRTTVAGFTDTQVRAVLQLVPDVVVLTVAGNLPTGRAKLSADELVAAGVVASELIPFQVQSFSTGPNVTTGVAVAVPILGWAVGLGGSYRIASAYSPLAAVDSTYKPGAELRLRAGLDRIVGEGRVSLGFTYSTFADDQFGGLRVFQPGRRYVVEGSWSFPIGNLGVGLYAWDLYRKPGTVVVGGGSTEKQNMLTLGTALSLPMGRAVFRPQLEYRVQSAGVAQLQRAGRLLSASGTVQLPLFPGFTLLSAGRYDAGEVDVNGVPVRFTGWGASLGLRAIP